MKPAKIPDRKPHLSERQAQVVRLVSLGCTTQEVATILNIAKTTAVNYRFAAMSILRTSNSTLLTRLAIKHNFTTIDDKLTAAEKRRIGRKKDGWS